jgi:hypothetical protein
VKREGLIGLGVAAARLGVAYRAAYDLMLTGQLRGIRRGSRWLVTVASVEATQRRLRRRSKSRRTRESEVVPVHPAA